MTLLAQDTLKDSYEALLMGYATGSLDEAQGLIVASHLTLCKKARARVHQCEAIGGALIETKCAPVSMSEKALTKVLDLIDQDRPQPQTRKSRSDAANTHSLDMDFQLPSPIYSGIESCKQRANWKTLFPGMKAYDLNLKCKQSKARIMKAAPGCKSPHHSHNDLEITLVLDGKFHDETGSYERGDLIVIENDHDHTPVACENHGCVCLVVTTAPIKLKGVARLLNPFLKR